jgi:serine/threonine protein kinase
MLVGLILGLKYMHSKGVIHRDIEPSNLLIDDEFRIRIADFGTVRVGDSTASTTGGTGTFGYMAPEVMEARCVPTTKLDIFSLGLVLYEVLVGESVFPKGGDPATVMRIVKLHQDGWRPTIPDSIHPAVRRVIEDCWSKNPDDRPTIDEIHRILHDSWWPFHRDVPSAVISKFIAEVEKVVK